MEVCVCKAALFAKDKGGLFLHHLAKHLPLLLHQLPIQIRLDAWEEKKMKGSSEQQQLAVEVHSQSPLNWQYVPQTLAGENS